MTQAEMESKFFPELIDTETFVKKRIEINLGTFNQFSFKKITDADLNRQTGKTTRILLKILYMIVFENKTILYVASTERHARSVRDRFCDFFLSKFSWNPFYDSFKKRFSACSKMNLEDMVIGTNFDEIIHDLN